MPELFYSAKFGKGELRIYRKEQDGRWFLDIRLYKQDPQTNEMVPTEHGLTFPEEFLTAFVNALRRVEETLRKEGYRERQAALHQVYPATCSVCRTEVREVQPGVYRCECGETEVVLLPLKEALDALFERVRAERMFEDYAPAG